MLVKQLKKTGVLKKPLKFFTNVFVKFHKDRCLIRASGLAYSSLLALVPLTAVAFSLLSAFGVFRELKESIQHYVIELLMPVRQDEIIAYIDRFVYNTRTLGIAGFALFIFTSVLLISNIQKNLNDIWKVNRKRSFISQFSTYTTVIVMGTFLLGTGFALTGWVEGYVRSLPGSSFRSFLEFLFTLLPALTYFFSLVLVLMAVPSVRVSLKSAAFGALAGYVCVWLLKEVFVNFSNAVIRFSVIYGSLAVIPIFLLWLYMLWAVILFSAELTFVHQARWTTEYRKNGRISLYDDFMLRLKTYMYIAEKNLKGDNPPGPEEISGELKMSVGRTENILYSLERNSVVFRVSRGKRQGYIPSKNIVSVTLKEAAAKISGYRPGGRAGESKEDIPAMIEDILDRCGNITVYSMIEKKEDTARVPARDGE